jgi:hypothetical protein
MRVGVLLAALPLAGTAWVACSTAQGAQPELSFDKVTMHRSGCYGRCPVYSVTVSSDGRVAFEGEKFIAVPGRHAGRTSTSELVQLSRAIRDVDFVALRESYQSDADGCRTWTTDQSTVVITVTFQGRSHQVTYYYGCEVDMGPIIDNLSKTIDRVARVKLWVGSRAL